MLCACQSYKPVIQSKPSVIDESRITQINIRYRAFDNSVKTSQLKVLDVTANSVKRAFNALLRNNFPIYAASGYANRAVVNDTKPSLHAYGAAIDINYHINPYYNVLQGRSSIIPGRCVDRDQDQDEEKMSSALKENNKEVNESEFNAAMNAITQEAGSDDWFINREVHRKGMLTRKEAEIFEKNGFIIWGGLWRQPMDFMHFQIPRKLAEVLAATSKQEGKIIWKNYLLINKSHFRLKKKVEAISKKKGELIWQDHLKKCQLDQDYLAAANKKKTTSICLRDCKRKCRYIDSILLKRAHRENKCLCCNRSLK